MSAACGRVCKCVTEFNFFAAATWVTRWMGPLLLYLPSSLFLGYSLMRMTREDSITNWQDDKSLAIRRYNLIQVLGNAMVWYYIFQPHKMNKFYAYLSGCRWQVFVWPINSESALQVTICLYGLWSIRISGRPPNSQCRVPIEYCDTVRKTDNNCICSHVELPIRYKIVQASISSKVST